jgi:hypothetical protein
MSIFRITYRSNGQDQRTSEDVEAVEFLQQEPWIVFLDPSGACLTVRSDDVERIERVQLAVPVTAPPPSAPSDLPLPRVVDSGGPTPSPWVRTNSPKPWVRERTT